MTGERGGSSSIEDPVFGFNCSLSPDQEAHHFLFFFGSSFVMFRLTSSGEAFLSVAVEGGRVSSESWGGLG